MGGGTLCQLSPRHLDGAPLLFPCWPQGPGQAAVDADAFKKRPRPEGRAERPRGAREEAALQLRGTQRQRRMGPETDASGCGGRPGFPSGSWGAAGCRSPVLLCPPGPFPRQLLGACPPPSLVGFSVPGPGAGDRRPGVWTGGLCLCFPQLALCRQTLRDPSGFSWALLSGFPGRP